MISVSAKIGAYCRRIEEWQKRAVLAGRRKPADVNLPKLLLVTAGWGAEANGVWWLTYYLAAKP
jgi:hypothetical protein